MSIFSDISRSIRPAAKQLAEAGRGAAVGYLQGALGTQAQRSLTVPLGGGPVSPPAPTTNTTAPRDGLTHYAKPILIGVALLVAASFLIKR